jgi:hypothetical protein
MSDNFEKVFVGFTMCLVSLLASHRYMQQTSIPSSNESLRIVDGVFGLCAQIG